MKRLLNTLFVLTEDSYLTLDGENIVVLCGEQEMGRYPLHTLESVLYFGYKGASPALMGACVERKVSLSFLRPSGRFLARATGKTQGNLLLRKRQYQVSDSLTESCKIARYFIVGKLYNARWILERATRDHAMRVDVGALKAVSQAIADVLPQVQACADLDNLRGLEGVVAARYFQVFDQLILQNKEAFRFNGRSRRPPLDRCNALLSYCYTLLELDCVSALESVGLDAYAGFLHRDRPGRESLALDLMEELRGVVADRFALSQINSRAIQPKHFEEKQNGAVFLNDAGRKAVLAAWQTRKKDPLTHPFLGEKMVWGLVPHVQALLLARYLRGDLDAYPPFLWK